MLKNSNGRPTTTGKPKDFDGGFHIIRTNSVDPDPVLQQFSERVAKAGVPWWKRLFHTEKYVTQQLFNMCAVSTAKIAEATKRPMENVATEIWKSYESAYSDRAVVGEIVIAAQQVTNFMVHALSARTLIGNLDQMQFCIENFFPDGSKRPRRLLTGTLFQWEVRPISGKAQRCVAQVGTYHLLTLNGAIPLKRFRQR